jgi:hypothetical protein
LLDATTGETITGIIVISIETMLIVYLFFAGIKSKISIRKLKMEIRNIRGENVDKHNN